MNAGFHALLVEENVSLRESVLNQGRLHNVEHLLFLLPSAQFQSPDEENSVSYIRFFESYHQADIAFEVMTDSASQSQRLSHIKRNHGNTETASKNVDPRLVRYAVQFRAVVHLAEFGPIFQA